MTLGEACYLPLMVELQEYLILQYLHTRGVSPKMVWASFDRWYAGKYCCCPEFGPHSLGNLDGGPSNYVNDLTSGNMILLALTPGWCFISGWVEFKLPKYSVLLYCCLSLRSLCVCSFRYSMSVCGDD